MMGQGPVEPRTAEVRRTTRETQVFVRLSLDGNGTTANGASQDGGTGQVQTGAPFFDHLITAMARHGRLGLSVTVRGDLDAGLHHTVEDTGLALGEALRAAARGGGGAIGAMADGAPGVVRFGDALIPMDDALVLTALDLGGRPFFAPAGLPRGLSAESFDAGLWLEFCRALASSGQLCLHQRVLAGEDGHHILEAAAKSLGLALHRATRPDGSGRGGEPVSTKGPVSLDVR